MGLTKLKRAGEKGEGGKMPSVSRSSVSVSRKRSNGYQIFAASLTHNASLDKPESLFTVAGYSFVASYVELALPPNHPTLDSFCRGVLTYNRAGEISSCLSSNLRQLNVLDRRKMFRQPSLRPGTSNTGN